MIHPFNRLNRLNCIVLTLGLAVLPMIALPVQAAPKKQPTTWTGVLSKLFQKKPAPGASRPIESLCPIAPGDSAEVWNLQPTLVWTGKTGAIAIQEKQTEKVIWKADIRKKALDKTTSGQWAKNLNYVQYLGEPLNPGQEYEWVLFDLDGKTQLVRYPFRIMAGESRMEVAQGLSALKNVVGGRETWTMRRTQFFAEKQLQADAFQEIFSLRYPSAELQKLLETMPNPCAEGES
ncbi:hypothetical protein [Alkalinema sp. FACHB-956]|uniref:hypothetical protein n=1 Tax=Alkalinema sp. FACHB-956 TaxID=2692768 RepID=UPI00168370D0|nr:hypothetical protein [Alkalinema sp. FACHB-956]MBD2329711.1 hypothetical protein [Alkalinema sp. FACHB-956]